MPCPLSALTLHQPWATAVRELGKRIENRSWRPPERLVGQIIAVHAGRVFDEAGADWLAARTGKMTTSGNVPLGAVVALARVEAVVTASKDLWFSGPYGWVLDSVVPLEPIPCRGRPHLWTVPDEVWDVIQEQTAKMSDFLPKK